MLRTQALPAAVLRRGLLAGAAVTASLVLSGCGGDSWSGSGLDHGGMAAPASTPASAAAFNDADVAFAQGMIPHHQQAVQMAELADGRAADAGVTELAKKIEAAQQPEIDTMTGWLAAWGAPVPSASMDPGMSGMDHGAMPGMMTDADLGKLKSAQGAEFDKQFLTMMISHHEGAIEMAQEQTVKGADPKVKALAAKIITDQQAEIATMKDMLAKA